MTLKESTSPEQGGLGTQELRAPVLLLQGVRKLYTQGSHAIEALSGVDLAVDRGTIQGVIGFSGAGKSTLLRCIAGVERPDAGRIVVGGTDLAQLEGSMLRQARQQIGVVFQHLNLLRSRTVAHNIALPLELAGRSKEETNSRVAELLTWFGLEDKAGQYPSQLSGGQRQRVAVARALALQPAVLLTDEPTSALDNETTTSVLNLLRRVRDEFHVTVLLITHDLESVRALCDHVAVLEGGRIAEQGRVEDVFLAPKSPAAQRLLKTPSSLRIPAQTGDGFSVTIQVKVIGGAAAEPLLSQLTARYGVEVNILRAQIDRLNDTAYAFFTVQLNGEQDAVQHSLTCLENRGIVVTHVRQQAAS